MLTNKAANVYPFVFFLIILSACEKREEKFVVINVEFEFINETSSTITLNGSCGFDEQTESDVIIEIPAGTTATVHQSDREYMAAPKPSINNFDLFPGQCLVIYGENEKCDDIAITKLEKYEERVKESGSNFFFRYRFTESTKEEAELCI